MLGMWRAQVVTIKALEALAAFLPGRKPALKARVYHSVATVEALKSGAHAKGIYGQTRHSTIGESSPLPAIVWSLEEALHVTCVFR